MKAVFQVFSFDAASKLILGILGILLIRYMPQNEFANYTFAVSLVAFVVQSVASTFNRIYIISAPRSGMRHAESSSIGLQLLLIAGLTLGGLPLLASLGGLYWLIVMLVAASCVSEFAKTYYQRELRFLKFSLIELYRSLLFFGCVLGLIYSFGSGLAAGAVIAVQTGSLLAVSWWAIGKRLLEWKAMSLGEISRFASGIVKGGYGCLFAYFFVLGVFTQTDIFMLKIVGSDVMVATYGSAFRYYSILSLALGSVHAVLLPMIQELSSHRELRILLAKHGRIVMAFAVVAALAGWLAEWVIPWIDKGKYPEAVATFRILCLSAVISFAFSPHVNLLMRFERFKFLLCLILAALVLSIMMNLLLIPAYGAIGAAIATMVSAAFVTISIFIESGRQMKKLMAV